MKTLLLVSTALAVAGCKSDQAKRFENIAARANAGITELRPYAATVSSPTSDAKTVRAACEKATAIMGRLNVKFRDEKDTDPGVDADAAIASLGMAKVYCVADTGDGQGDARCAAWCRQTIKWFGDGLHGVRDAAAKEGVQIETLTP